MIKKATILLIVLVFLVPTVWAKGTEIGINNPAGNKESENAEDAPAIVIDVPGCALIASDGSPFMGTGHYLINKNWIILTCKAIQPVEIPYPAKAVHFNYATTGMDYWTDFGTTVNWKEVINPSGQVTLKAKVYLKPGPNQDNDEQD